MCVVSMIGDHYGDKWKQSPLDDWMRQQTYPYVPPFDIGSLPNQTKPFEAVSKQDFEALRKEVLEMKELLKKAVEYDRKNNEPHCEMEEKIDLLKRVAALVGVSLEDVFSKNPT